MRLALTGGGTSGHVIPNFAVIEELKKLDPNLELLYLGSNSFEKTLVPKQNIPFKEIKCGKLRRYFSVKNIIDIFKIPIGIIQSLYFLFRFKPHLLFSKGGYVSIPPVIAAWILRIKVIIHESDLTPGLANKIAAKFAKTILTSSPTTKKHLSQKKKIIYTGQPIRSDIYKGNKQTAIKKLQLSSQPVILIMGGSQGSQAINNLIDQNLTALTDKYQLIHIRGENSKKRQKNYHPFTYVHQDLKHFYAVADLIISRAGANSLAEIAALNKNSILIPLSAKASRGDQLENAKEFAKTHQAIVISEQISSAEFLSTITTQISQKSIQKNIKNASKEIAKIIYTQNENHVN